MSVALEPGFLERLAKARVVTGTALGVSIRLTSDDLAAIGRFAEDVGRNEASRR